MEIFKYFAFFHLSIFLANSQFDSSKKSLESFIIDVQKSKCLHFQYKWEQRIELFPIYFSKKVNFRSLAVVKILQFPIHGIIRSRYVTHVHIVEKKDYEEYHEYVHDTGRIQDILAV